MASARVGAASVASTVRVPLLLLTILLLQLGVVADLRWQHATGDVMLLAALAAGSARGPEMGARIGFAAGVLYDLFLETPFGLSALVYCLVGFGSGLLHVSVMRPGWWFGPATVLVGSGLGVVLYGVVATMLGVEVMSERLLLVSLVVASWNVALWPLAHRAFRWAFVAGDVASEGGRVRA